MRSESSFEIDGDLIIIEATFVGPNGRDTARLVLDTGSVLTTLIPAIAESIGYTSADRVARSVVRSAVADEPGYIVRLSHLTALGFTLPDVHVNVADLSHGIDGLLGMNFLSDFNLEIRPAERRLIVERIGCSRAQIHRQRFRSVASGDERRPTSEAKSAFNDFDPLWSELIVAFIPDVSRSAPERIAP